MPEPFYFVFPTYEEARDALPEFESELAAKLRAEAEDNRRREQESFERSDTDGCVTQWCNSITAQQLEREARMANNGGLVLEPALMDVATGQILTACLTIRPKRFAAWETEYVWVFPSRTESGRREFVTDYKREAKFTERGLRKVWVMAPGKMLARSPRNQMPEQRGLGGLASYSGKHPYPDYDASGLPL